MYQKEKEKYSIHVFLTGKIKSEKIPEEKGEKIKLKNARNIERLLKWQPYPQRL